VSIQRHVKVRSEANPYDPRWEMYFEERLFQKMQATLAGGEQIRYLWREQQGRCCGCGQLLHEEEEWHIHHRIRRSQGGSDDMENLEVLHANCHRQKHSKQNSDESCCVSQEAFVKA
jgi:RNA-directed DNA polymerase